MLKIKVDYPSREEEKIIIDRMGTLSPLPEVKKIIQGGDILKMRQLVNEVYIDNKIEEYILNIVFATRFPKEYKVDIEGLLMFGASPRASIALKNASRAHALLNGRAYVTPHDVKSLCHEILRHRLRRSYEAEADDISSDDIIDRILSTLAVP